MFSIFSPSGRSRPVITTLLLAFFSLVCSLIVLFPTSANAQSALTLSAGSEKGSYFRWAREAQAMCADSANVRVVSSTGGPENLERLVANEANLGMTQMDTLMLQANGRDLSMIRVLLPLFPEHLHFIARADLAREVGGTNLGVMTVGKQKVGINSVAEITGLTVGAAGGAQDTAQYINGNGPVKFNLVRDPGAAMNVIDAVIAGKYHVGLIVGAAPMDLFKTMDPNKRAQLKFLAVPESVSSSLKAYMPSKFAYTGFAGQGTVTTPTIAVNSVLVSQNYRKGEKAQALAAFRNCVTQGAEDMASETGSHPAWRSIKVDGSVSNWQMWEAPAQAVAAQPVAQPANKKK